MALEEDILDVEVYPSEDGDLALHEAIQVIESRCKASGLTFENDSDEVFGPSGIVSFPNGRDVRPVGIWTLAAANDLLAIEFEKYHFLSDYEAVLSYKDATIEAAVRLIRGIDMAQMCRRLFNSDYPKEAQQAADLKVNLPSPHAGLPSIELSFASDDYRAIFTQSQQGIAPRTQAFGPITLKLQGINVTTHDNAVSMLSKLANSLFLQLDIMSSMALNLERKRPVHRVRRPAGKGFSAKRDLHYPKHQFQNAPTSLYWYARSATGMPLLQFLAYYQVIEYFFPVYSKIDACRKLKVALKDPSFREDDDADVGRLLALITVGRGGAFGDERTQLRATLFECIDAGSLRNFLVADEERKTFYSSKGKTAQYKNLSITKPEADVREEVADRVYEIRCKIVHTKAGGAETDFELLLPFSKEAEALTHDIALVQYLARRVLIAASSKITA